MKMLINNLKQLTNDLEALDVGLHVYKVKLDDGEDTVVLPEPKKPLPKDWTAVSKEDCYNAIRFNCSSGLLEYLKNK